MCRIFGVTGLCVPEWMLNFLFQTSVISSRVCRVHDTNTSGFGGVDLKYLQTNMLGADVELAARRLGRSHWRPHLGLCLEPHCVPHWFQLCPQCGCFLACPKASRSLSLATRDTQNLSIAASHAENVRGMENSCFKGDERHWSTLVQARLSVSSCRPEIGVRPSFICMVKMMTCELQGQTDLGLNTESTTFYSLLIFLRWVISLKLFSCL